MEYEGHAIWTVPAIQFYAATALSQTPYVGFNWRLARKLVTCQVAEKKKIQGHISYNFPVTEIQILLYKYMQHSYFFCVYITNYLHFITMFLSF